MQVPFRIPILDHQFHERSFGFRHGRSAHDALRIVEQKIHDGYVYVVDADLNGDFDSIPKDRLLKLVQEHISDSRMLTLIKQFLDQNIMEELHEWTPIWRLLLKCHRKNSQRLPLTQRWPNAYFANVGLWSLREAHNRLGQSHAGNSTNWRAVCGEIARTVLREVQPG